MELLDIKILNTAIERQINKELAKLDITCTQANVVGFLKLHTGEDICQRDIEFNLGLSHPTVSSVLRRMEEKGMVVSRPMEHDRRFHAVTLTDKALDMVGAIRTTMDRITRQVFDGVSREEQDQMDQMVQKMIQNIKA